MSGPVASISFVARYPLPGGDGRSERDVPRKYGGGYDFRKFVGFALAIAVHYLQAFPLGRQAGAPSVSGDNERRQGDGNVQIIIGPQLTKEKAGVGFNHIGFVLPVAIKRDAMPFADCGPL